MPYIGNAPALDYISYAVQNFTVTAATTVYTLDYSVSNENDIALYINSVAQRPGASFAYSATGTTLTLTSATLATDTMYAVFIGRAVQTVTPPANINIQLADGTAAAPSLNFANDTNTGIFRPTTDEIALTEGGVEGMRLNASGNVQFAKNISIGGATPTTSGSGITFPATASGSTDANTLDDYEEGTWTPVISDGTNNATMTALSGARYTKIGNVVNFWCYVAITSLGSVSGALRITGLPFTVSEPIADVNLFGGFCISCSNLNITAGYDLTVAAQRSQTYLRIFINDSATGITALDALEWSADGEAVFCGSYTIA